MKLYRQGDVLFKKIDALPEGERKKRENGIVAYGEVTGHHHSLAKECRQAAAVLEIDNGVYVDVFAALPITVGPDYVDVAGTVYRANVDFAGQVTIPEGEYSGVAFVHQEHAPVVLGIGAHVYQPQREYSPEAIRNVVDFNQLGITI